MADVSDWKSKLPDERRKNIIKKIIGLWKQVMPNPNPSKLIELQQTVVKTEERFYTSATSYNDYANRVYATLREITRRVEDVVTQRSQQKLHMNMKKPINPNSSAQGEQINNSMLHKEQPRLGFQQEETPQGSMHGMEVADSLQLPEEEDEEEEDDVVSELVAAVDSLPPINGDQKTEQAMYDAFRIDESNIENLQSWTDWVMNPLSLNNCVDERKQKIRRHFTAYPINDAIDMDPFENCRIKRVRVEEDALPDQARETHHRDDPSVNSVQNSPPNWLCYERANLSDFTQ